MSRSRTVPVAPDDVWAVVGDPHHLPRWWPLTERVEAVEPEAWTSVMRSDRGKVVRADYRVEAHEPPRRRAWSQALEGTPFERLLREHRTEVALAPGRRRDGGDADRHPARPRDRAAGDVDDAPGHAPPARRGARRALAGR